MLDPSIFMEQELLKMSDSLKKQICEQQFRVQKIQFPLQAFQRSLQYKQSMSFLKLSQVTQQLTKVDVRVVRAFRIWQKSLLDSYLDLLSQKMRQTKKSILNQRFLFITKKVQFQLRRAFLKWSAKAATPSFAKFDVRNSNCKAQFGFAKVLNKFLRQKKNALNLPSPTQSLQVALTLWKVNTAYDVTQIYTLSARTRALCLMANIMRNNMDFIRRGAFWLIRDFSDAIKKNTFSSHKKNKFTTNNTHSSA